METRKASAMELKVTMVDHPASHAMSPRDEEAQKHADGAAGKRDHRGFHHELTHNV